MLTGYEWMSYFNSGRPISPFVTRIHGITDDDVVGLERFDLQRFEVSDYLIGHNVRFDWKVIGRPAAKLICTVRLARVAFPEWVRYSQSKCIEQLIGVEAASEMTAAAHDALGDARMCYLLYQACCERLGIAITDFETAHKISNTAQPIRNMPFGKYKGRAISELPMDYVNWMLANIHGMNPSLYSALQKRVEQAQASPAESESME